MYKKIATLLFVSVFATGYLGGSCESCSKPLPTINNTCYAQCLTECRQDYGDFEDDKFLRACNERCIDKNCVDLDAGFPDVITSEVVLPDSSVIMLDAGHFIPDANTVIDQGVIDSGHSRCEENCFNLQSYPRCDGEYDCCRLLCNS